MTATATRLRSTRCTRGPLRPALTEAEQLRQDITVVCAQADRRLGNPAGTCERATYFWYWPPSSVCDVDVLTQLHADALEFLHIAIQPLTRRDTEHPPTGLSEASNHVPEEFPQCPPTR